MLRDTLQLSAELMAAAIVLDKFKLPHKWHLGDQFCVAEACEIFWQVLLPDCIYLVDLELLDLMDELNKNRVSLAEETRPMIFIPRLEDIVSFCSTNLFALQLNVEPQVNRAIYKAQLSVSTTQVVEEESPAGLRVAALRTLTRAIQQYVPAGAISVPI